MSHTESSNIQLELSLLNNGLDFILKGIDELFDDDYVMREYSSAVDIGTSSYKYGVLNLFSGFLLLLKERLYRHTPELIFQGNLEDITNKVSSGKTPNTVALKEALKKLKTYPGFVFTEPEEKLIKDVQDMRNKFEHYTISVDKYELWSHLSKFLELIDKFLVEELHINIENSPEALELQEKIHQIDSVWERTQKERRRQFDFEIDGMIEELNTSRDRVMQELRTESYYSNRADELLISCPDCNEQTMIVYEEFKGICTNPECGSGYALTECLKCEELTPGYPWQQKFCDSCSNRIDEQ